MGLSTRVTRATRRYHKDPAAKEPRGRGRRSAGAPGPNPSGAPSASPASRALHQQSDAARNAAPSQQYGGILREHVRAQLKFDTPGLPPTLETVVEIRATASGTVLSRQLLRRSGNDAWDNAVLRAIDAASPLPRDRQGTTPGVIEITFRPVD